MGRACTPYVEEACAGGGCRQARQNGGNLSWQVIENWAELLTREKQ